MSQSPNRLTSPGPRPQYVIGPQYKAFFDSHFLKLLILQAAQLKMTSLSIASGGKLDMKDASAIIDYDGQSNPGTSISNLLALGYNNAGWDGAGINSSAAASDTSQLTAVGWADNSDLGLSTFGGHSVGTDAILIKYTY